MSTVLNPRSPGEWGLDLPPLRNVIIMRDGQKVDVTGAVWKPRQTADGGDTIYIYVGSTAEGYEGHCFSPRALHLIRLFLQDRLARTAAQTVANDCQSFLRFIRWYAKNAPHADWPSTFEWSHYNESVAIAFLEHGMRYASIRGNDFARLRTFYRWGYKEKRFKDFDRGNWRAIKTTTAPGNDKGTAVRSRDREKGPLAPNEVKVVTRAIKAGLGQVEDRVIMMLCLELGSNPLALVRLLNSDLIRFDFPDGPEFYLDVPRVKKRTTKRHTKRRPISRQLGEALSELHQGGVDDRLLHWLPNAKPADGIKYALKRFANEADLVSPITKVRLNLNPRRFRYTLGTHMAAEGASLLHIAEVLDHTDTQHVLVYTETTPNAVVDPMARATDHMYDDLFKGRIIDSEGDLDSNAVPIIPKSAALFPELGLDLGGIGGCGRGALCGLAQPFACYTCTSFVAFRDGPHQEVLDSINLAVLAMELETDRRIPMQLDEARAAIMQLIAQLEREPEGGVAA